MYIESVPNRKSPPCILLRETYREDGKVKHRTLANLTHCDPEVLAGFKEVLNRKKNCKPMPVDGEIFQVTRSLPHGHVQAVLLAMEKLGIDKLLYSKPTRERRLAMLMIAARIIHPCSKLATARAVSDECATSTLAGECGLPGDLDEDDLYGAMDWLLKRQPHIESKLASRHLHDGSLVLYDLSSSYFEGTTCPLADNGHNRDNKKGKLQVNYGLLCDKSGRPVAVEVFKGNTADPATLQSQLKKLIGAYKLSRVVVVGDRGMLTNARIDQELRPVEGLDWISALTAGQIQSLAKENLLGLPEAGVDGIQPELFDQEVFATQSDDFPGERLLVCRNPLLARRRRQKRQELVEATEKALHPIQAAVNRKHRALRGADKIGLRVGKVINKYKVGKHFKVEIKDDSLSWELKHDRIAQEAATDGCYVIRTSVPEETLGDAEAVERYKDLSLVENAFRCLKTVDLKVRPIYHSNADKVRSHIFLCMLAYYVEWHMRKALKGLLFDEDQPREPRQNPAEHRKPSPEAARKAATKRTKEGYLTQSFQSLIKYMGTIVCNTITPAIKGAEGYQKTTEPTPLQEEILERLAGIEP